MQADSKHEPQGLSSLKAGSTDSGRVESYYDDWARSYDQTLRSWHYQAPEDAADLLLPHLEPGARVLDVGCGTGLFGEVLSQRANCHLQGIDISAEALKPAEARGPFGALLRHDLQQVPLPVEAAAHDAAAAIGVLTYIEDADALLRDLCRCVRSGGLIAFTQRSDRWQELDFAATVQRLEQAGRWHVLQISEPRPYLPGHEDFGEDIGVIHTLCRVT